MYIPQKYLRFISESKLFFLAVAVTKTPSCSENEFECMYPEDGCILYEYLCDGMVDCMRDGSDESKHECGHPGARYQPEGMIFAFPFGNLPR